jgi:multisubunit Na+/H+ antiporter MnhG subunit
VTTTRDYAVYVLVSLGVAAELLACLGLLAMRNAIDRLHYAGAGTTLGPALLAAAVCVREGFVSAQGLAAVLIAVVLALAGSALGTATARVIRLEMHGRLESSPAERERGAP